MFQFCNTIHWFCFLQWRFFRVYKNSTYVPSFRVFCCLSYSEGYRAYTSSADYHNERSNLKRNKLKWNKMVKNINTFFNDFRTKCHSEKHIREMQTGIFRSKFPRNDVFATEWVARIHEKVFIPSSRRWKILLPVYKMHKTSADSQPSQTAYLYQKKFDIKLITIRLILTIKLSFFYMHHFCFYI